MLSGSGAELPRIVLRSMLRGYWVSAVLRTVAALGLADLVAAGRTSAADLATAIDGRPDRVHRFVRAMTALRLCSIEPDGEIRLTELGELLRFDRGDSMWGNVMANTSPHITATWSRLAEALGRDDSMFEQVHGMSVWDFHKHDPEAGAIFDRSMTGVSELEAQAVLSVCDFAGVKTLVDVGGGAGRMLARILSSRPELTGILFDQPNVVRAAEATFAAAGLKDRCTVVPGDFFRTVPTGGDAYTLARILHDWRDDEASAILRSLHAAMRPGARLWLVESVLLPGASPDLEGLLDLHMMLLFGALERDEAEYSALLTEAAFGRIRVLRTASPWSVVEAVRL